MPTRHVILGTAGHIDHGKTSLVKALTGVDTDRLPEEKERGMTIDLGFAHLGDSATIIDVPGHEKFVKNMVAGVSTIDLVLFVIAADDGIMPQTREHLEICQLLSVQRGLVVLTKIDLVEADWVELVKEDLRQLCRGTFLQHAPVVPVSTVTGEGIAPLRAMIERTIQQLPPRPDRGVFWLPVDRTFTIKGFGTVVTGSVLSGQIAVGEELEILPEHKRARIRGLQRHGASVNQVQTGDRAAINLQGVGIEEVTRGQVLAAPNYFRATTRMNCRLQLLASASAPLKERTRVRVHLGTAEIMARVIPLEGKEIAPGQTGYAQLKFEKPAAARRLEALVLRRYSPPKTIGGGVVLDTEARAFRRRDTNILAKLRSLEKEDPNALLVAQFLLPNRYAVTLDQLAAETGHNKDDLQKLLQTLLQQNLILAVGKRGFIHKQRLENLWHQLEALLALHHQKNPMQLGMRKAEVSASLPPLADAGVMNLLLMNYKAAARLKEIDAHLALQEHAIRLSDKQEALRRRIAATLHEEGFATSSPAELAQKLGITLAEVSELLNVMMLLLDVVRLDEDIWLHAQRLEEARKRVVDYLKTHHEITVSQFKELIGNASRKFAMPLIQHFDAHGITQRQGDVRILGVEEEKFGSRG
ncbi:selenocysteine-specific translation elongation factor [candidate division KSB1 bacterium]|nr:selenocysteine-specific translation elongation factor [candidate division KSB1 bacterium]